MIKIEDSHKKVHKINSHKEITNKTHIIKDSKIINFTKIVTKIMLTTKTKRNFINSIKIFLKMLNII